MAKPIVVNIVIDGADFQEVDPARCLPGKTVKFVVSNEDGVSYDVTFDLNEIIEKEDAGLALPPPANPFTAAGPHTITVPGFTTGSFRFILKAKNKFGKGAGQLRYTTYKYTLHGTVTGGAAIPDLDPDLDITP